MVGGTGVGGGANRSLTLRRRAENQASPGLHRFAVGETWRDLKKESVDMERPGFPHDAAV